MRHIKLPVTLLSTNSWDKRAVFLAPLLWAAFATSAFAEPIPLSAVIANVTSRSFIVPLVSVEVDFKVGVFEGPAPTSRLTDFQAQLFADGGLFPGDRASTSWSSAPGWAVTSTNNLSGNAFFQALSVANGIAPGGELTGFDVVGLGADLISFGNVKITQVSSSTVGVPEPSTFSLLILGLIIAPLLFGRALLSHVTA